MPKCGHLNQFCLSLFLFLLAWETHLRKTFRSENVLPVLLARIFMVSCLMFMSLSHFEFIFMHGKSVCSNFIDLHAAVKLTQHPWGDFAHFIFLPPLSKINWPAVQFSRSVVSNSWWPHGLHHARPPCPSPTPGVDSDSGPSSQWCHPAISSSVIPFSSCLQSFPASGSFPVSQFFASGGQSIGASASASVLPMNIQDWSPLGWTGWISL